MKKKILLISAMMLLGLSVNAIDWQPVTASKVDAYVDVDSIRKLNNDEILYTVKFNPDGKGEKVAYLRTNTKTNYVGIIYNNDYEIENYKPNGIFATPNAFMKPVDKNSFLYPVNQMAIAMLKGESPVIADAFTPDEYEVSYKYEQKPILREDLQTAYSSKDVIPAELQQYLVKTCKLLESNWNPPESGKSSRAIVLVSIGADGSLVDCSFIEPSGDNTTDRSILSAIEKTVPYPKFPEIVKNAFSLDFQFVFEHDTFSKSVVY